MTILMFSLPLLVAVYCFIFRVKAAGPLTINTPFAVQCETVLIQWSGGTPYFNLILYDARTRRALEYGKYSGFSFWWVVNVQAETNLYFEIIDSSGYNTSSQIFVVQPSSDSSCLPVGFAASTATVIVTSIIRGSSASPKATPVPSSSEDPTPAIIGGTIGGLAFIAFLVFFLVCLRRRRTQRPSPEPEPEAPSQTHQPPVESRSAWDESTLSRGMAITSLSDTTATSTYGPESDRPSFLSTESRAPLTVSYGTTSNSVLSRGMAPQSLPDATATYGSVRTSSPSNSSNQGLQDQVAQRHSLQYVAYPESSFASSLPSTTLSFGSHQEGLMRMKEMQSEAVRNFVVNDAPPSYDYVTFNTW